MNLKQDWEKYLQKTGITLNPYQNEAASELLGLPKLANITWCRDSGKTFLMGNLAFFFMYRCGWDIVVAAPVLGQSSHIMDEAGKAAYRTSRRSLVHASSAYIRIKGRPGKIVSVTGSVNANKQGAKGQLILLDEKQDIPGLTAAEDFIGMKIRGGCMWLVGVGGTVDSAGEMFKDDKAFISELPWEIYSKWDTDYIEEKVDPAKRLMLPEQFEAHYNCKALGLSSNLLVPVIQAFTDTISGGLVRIGVDWGKRRDQSIATVTRHIGDMIYIDDWLIPTGGYDDQIKELSHWLKYDVEYDEVISEDVGVGDSATDVLIGAMKDPGGNDSGVSGHGVSTKWKSEQAVIINRKASNGTLVYNPNRSASERFHKDITTLGYKILDSNLIKPDHSDYLSSLSLTVEDPGQAYV